MANIDFQNPDELYNKLKELMSNNPDYTAEELWDAMKERTTYQWVPLKDINIASDIKNKLDAIASWQDINPRELLDIEEWYAEQEAQKIADKENNASFQELVNDEWWDDKTGQKKLEAFAEKYKKILWEARDYVIDNYSGEWLSWKWRKNFLKELNWFNKQLEELENSDEFKRLMFDLSEYWTWNPFDNWALNWDLNETLKIAATWAWSKMFKDWETINNIVNAAKTSWVWQTIDTFIKNWWWLSFIAPWTQLLWLWANAIVWEDASDIAKEYVKKNNITEDTFKTDEERESDKWSKFREKNPNVDIKKATDAMLFWDEAANSWVDNYINTRDDKLATLLKVKWAESPEEIDRFLSQYPSWQNAKQQWKDETLKRLSEKMSNVKYDDFAKQVKDAKAKNESKEEKKVWDDWTPSNDDSINGVEKENTIYDENGKAIWVKHLDIKKKKPSTLKKITDFLEGNKKISKEDLYSVLPDKAKQLIDWIDKEAKARLNAKEHIWDTDENWYRDPDSPINWTEEEDVESTNEKWWKWTSKKETKQTSKNNKFLYITKEVQKLKPTERIKYLKENWFTVDKNWYFTRNWMKTLVYKDGQYNPKYVKPNKEEWYNDRTKVEPTSPSKLQIALQKSWYQWPRDANGNFLPMTDKWLDIQEGKKNLKDKSKK